jgi:hypothetical protein
MKKVLGKEQQALSGHCPACFFFFAIGHSPFFIKRTRACYTIKVKLAPNTASEKLARIAAHKRHQQNPNTGTDYTAPMFNLSVFGCHLKLAIGLSELKTRYLADWSRPKAWLQEASRTLLARLNWNHRIGDFCEARLGPGVQLRPRAWMWVAWSRLATE